VAIGCRLPELDTLRLTIHVVVLQEVKRSTLRYRQGIRQKILKYVCQEASSYQDKLEGFPLMFCTAATRYSSAKLTNCDYDIVNNYKMLEL